MQPEPAEKSPVDIFVGKRLRILRGATNMNEEQLGKHTGHTGTQIKQFELGKQRIDILSIIRLTQALNIGPMDLFEGVDLFLKEMGWPQEVAVALEDEEIRRQTLHMVELLCQMTPEKRRIASHFIELIAKDEPPQGEES